MILVDANLLVYAHVTSLSAPGRTHVARFLSQRSHSSRITLAVVAQLCAPCLEPTKF